MYVPTHFSVADRESLDRVIRDNPFGLLVGTADGAPLATHLPFLLDGDRLLGHVAHGNPHWKSIDGATEMLAVFSGPPARPAESAAARRSPGSCTARRAPSA